MLSSAPIQQLTIHGTPGIPTPFNPQPHPILTNAQIDASLQRLYRVFPIHVVFEEPPAPRPQMNQALQDVAHVDPRARPLGITLENTPGILRSLRGPPDPDRINWRQFLQEPDIDGLLRSNGLLYGGSGRQRVRGPFPVNWGNLPENDDWRRVAYNTDLPIDVSCPDGVWVVLTDPTDNRCH